MALPALTPQYVLGLAALLVLVVDAFTPTSRKNGLLAGLTALAGVTSAGAAAWLYAGGAGRTTLFDGALAVDASTSFFTAVFGCVAALVAVASYDYVREEPHQSAYYALVLLATAGMSVMAAANSLVTAFLALELVSLPAYALVAYLKRDAGSAEAGLKYFVVGALSSAILVYGISLVYAATGVFGFAALADAVAGNAHVTVLGAGVVMLIGGFAFKTASVPFHFWAPEAYEGAPAPVSAFLSSASKAAGFVLAFRVFLLAFPLAAFEALGIPWTLVFAVLAVVTMTLGNVAAATQTNVKRMLAYSSIGHAGYALIGLAALSGPTSSDVAVVGASFSHLFVYGFTNTGAFLVVALAERWGVGRTFEDYAGLARSAPVASAVLAVLLFSLAGLPVGGGFWTKYALFLGAVQSGLWWLAAVGVVNSALSLFYYSRLVKAVWVDAPDETGVARERPTGIYAAVVVAAVVTVALLVAPDVVFSWADAAARALVSA
ncbi:NADH-quinone oxidoreductase subunit N [Halarchaeum rubridurum]|uniref:Oxidoreductase n=1 Tax=Halarchaeum rubridurum TaxID=489911 RepID=A0A830G358_9EURY|nr:NADH-quinone oxidoreductase subunit N [Halarchaeum rubridurum]MBP1955515.1 NADH-quinone oxidoreductase subunit N [Halarchaeum rubridurum]GGM72953.1 oxidoreductase [Halarchaeum rubridurum]